VREHHGEEGMQRLIETLSPAGRSLMRGEIEASDWYMYPLFIDVCIKADRLFGSGDAKLNSEMARHSAHRNTPGIYHMFIRLGSVSWVLNRASKLWLENFSDGAFEVRTEKGTRTAEGEIIDFPFPHLAHTYSVLGFAMGCIEMSGAKNVRGELVACRSMGAERTLLRVHWGADPDADD
jgi:hypothetical protein